MKRKKEIYLVGSVLVEKQEERDRIERSSPWESESVLMKKCQIKRQDDNKSISDQ
ncbi:hypothetical protein Gotri_005855, partial [Gossypium trilobum]|nr:hypothetical protein [Gossypium trilobum]